MKQFTDVSVICMSNMSVNFAPHGTQETRALDKEVSYKTDKNDE